MKNVKRLTDLEDRIVALLKENKLSITDPRKLILGLLLKEHGPFTADEIFQKLPSHSCDHATIYRCLKQFEEHKIVNVTYLEKEMAHFEFNDPHHHHHHIICKVCKKIESIPDCMLEKIESALSKKGYVDIQHRLEFFGICENCQKAN